MQDNIKRQIRLRINQQKGALLMVLLLPVAWWVFCNLGELIEVIQGKAMHSLFYHPLSAFPTEIFVSMAIFIYLTSIVNNKGKISMYPGTTLTRTLAKLIADHAFILLYTGVLGCLYLLEALGLKILSRTILSIDTSLVWSWKYLGIGLMVQLVMFLAVYGVFEMLFTFLDRVGTVCFCLVVGVLIGSGVYLAFQDSTMQMLKRGVSQITGSYSRSILFGLLVWAACIVIILTLMQMRKTWDTVKDSSQVISIVILYGLGTLVMIVYFAGSIFTTDTPTQKMKAIVNAKSVAQTQRICQQYVPDMLSKDCLLQLDDPRNLPERCYKEAAEQGSMFVCDNYQSMNLNMDISELLEDETEGVVIPIVFIKQSQMENYGLRPIKKPLGKKQLLARICASSDKLLGNPIYQPLLDQLEVTYVPDQQKDDRIQFSLIGKKIAINHIFSDTAIVAEDSAKATLSDLNSMDGILPITVFFVGNDETVEKYWQPDHTK